MNRDFVAEFNTLLTDMLNYYYSLEGEEKDDFKREINSAIDDLEEFAKGLVQKEN